MKFFQYKEGRLFCEELDLTRLVSALGTPLYVYSKKAFLDHYHTIQDAFSETQPRICYSVKANSHLAVLDMLRKEGASFDVVSQGELMRVESVGGTAGDAVFAGVGKGEEEIAYALEKGIFMINVESLEEARRIQKIAKGLEKRAPISLRLNPDVDPKTHRYITTGKKENKFGIPLSQASAFLKEELASHSHLDLKGIHLHIGSQILDPAPYEKALQEVHSFLEAHQSLLPTDFQYLNIGGGYGIDYQKASQGNIQGFASVIQPWVKKMGLDLIMEPGRFIAANAGILLTKLEYRKQGVGKIFWICDSGMHHLIRPTLYQAFHQIWPIEANFSYLELESKEDELEFGDVVGPICETGDFLGLERKLPKSLKEGDVLAVFSTGAYGAVMASHYNSHGKPQEVLVHGSEYQVISPKEEYSSIWKREIW